MHTRTPRALMAAALALFATACADTPTGAPATARVPSARTPAVRPTLVSTAVKYRDRGGKPATGRSGNAVVDALALLDKEGTTTLSVTTRHATDWWRSGYIRQAQIKASSPDGKHKFTRNLGGFEEDAPPIPAPAPIPLSQPQGPFPGSLQFQGLGRGDQLQLQAHVAGLDGQRTDVVTVTESVKRLPDVRVEMSAPAEVETGTPVNIMAVVSETNGDMGTYTTCELYVAGQLADQAAGVWIDAGDAVTCAMTWTFAAPGTFPVQVRVSTAGREWDMANNADSATITVHGESPRFYTSGSFTQSTRVDSVLQEQSWRDGPSGLAGESVYEEVNAQAHQYGSLYAFMPMQLPGTLSVHASMSTGGRVVTSTAYTHSAGILCDTEYDGHAMLSVCTWTYEGVGQTYVNYSFSAGAVTYHSRSYSRTWDQNTGVDYSVYHWNYDYGWDDGLVPLGDDWSFEVRLDAPGGEHVAAHTLRLERQPPQESVEPYVCTTTQETYWDYTSTICRSSSHRAQFIYGF
jgi:hypothetical protein